MSDWRLHYFTILFLVAFKMTKKKILKSCFNLILCFLSFQAKKRELNNRKDLGAIFNDGTLNLQYVEPDSGEINPIFTYTEEAGSLKVRCELCDLQVVGKTSLDTHRDGKKHKANIEKYEMSSKLKKTLNFTKFSDLTKFSLNCYFP